jgi:hypothetical protein
MAGLSDRSARKFTVRVAPTVHQAKQQALQQGCSLKQLVAQFIRLGLHGDPSAGNSFSSELVQPRCGGSCRHGGPAGRLTLSSLAGP